MYNFKKLFTYMVVGALVMALSISCKSNEEPTETGATIQSHPAQGTYNNSLANNATVAINNDGICTISGTTHFTSGSTKESTNFSITVTKWWYYYPCRCSSITYYAGINIYGTEKSEVTINLPATDYFEISYTDSRELWIVFGHEGKRYYTGNLKKGIIKYVYQISI